MLDSEPDVIRCLVTYADWWQPVTTSVLNVSEAARRTGPGEAFRPGFHEGLDERTELQWRMAWLEDVDRHILYLYYVAQRPLGEIAAAVQLSPRQCSRRRIAAICTLTDLAEVS